MLEGDTKPVKKEHVVPGKREGTNMSTLHQVEIIVHVDDVLAQEQREGLVRDLQKREGVEKAQFTPGREHLLLVDYDREKLHAQDVLRLVQQEHIGAELIGPV
jgi:hypothetical protein